MKNENKSDVTYLLMKMTKITDRMDVLGNQSNDENDATKSVGAVNIEFTGELLKITAPSVPVDILQADKYVQVYRIWFSPEEMVMMLHQLTPL